MPSAISGPRHVGNSRRRTLRASMTSTPRAFEPVAAGQPSARSKSVPHTGQTRVPLARVSCRHSRRCRSSTRSRCALPPSAGRRQPRAVVTRWRGCAARRQVFECTASASTCPRTWPSVSDPDLPRCRCNRAERSRRSPPLRHPIAHPIPNSVRPLFKARHVPLCNCAEPIPTSILLSGGIGTTGQHLRNSAHQCEVNIPPLHPWSDC
jgi:hypothetical protein